jgi:hypothetical protein
MTHELPYLQDGALTREQLLVVVGDIEAGTEILAVNIKRQQRAHSDEQPVTLSSALEQLLEGTVSGLQVRYRYQGREYWDTLLRAQSGYRIVRIDHTATLSSP